MPNIFEQSGIPKPGYSAFDLSREQKLSLRMGNLVPTYFEEILPGDQFKVKSEVLLRMAPMLAPIMHRVDFSIHYFFVPNRIIWNGWEDFITGGQANAPGVDMPTIPYNTTLATSKLADYLGLPTLPSANGALEVSALPFRAYVKIWNDYFRDENLQAEIDVETATVSQLIELRRRAWQKDYFTSAMYTTQRGGVQATVPIDFAYKNPATATPIPATTTNMQVANIDGKIRVGGIQTQIQNIEDGSMSMLINELRKSSAIQRWLENSMIGGYRYIEVILRSFGVKSDDLRLQRPQYLGGGKQPVVISEVLNTTGTESAPQGDMAGHGFAVGATNQFSERFKEHGYVIGIASVMPKTAYFQGIPKHFMRKDKFDYFWNEFAHLGEQEIKNYEIYTKETDTTYNNGTFGYQQRYAEYKYGTSTVHGDFRNSLIFWHLARKFASDPALNEAFIKCDPSDDIFAVEGVDHIWMQLYHDVKARRPMPYFANPRLS